MRAAPTHPDSVCGVDGGLAANALAWAASSPVFPQIRIVSNSWGGPRLDFERGGFYRSVRDAFRNAYLKGLFLTASAGNDTDFPHYPAAFPDYSTSVGSILCDGTHPDDYIRGYYIDVVAPGGAVPDVPVDHIKTTWGDDSNDQYFGAGSRPHFGGTSASAPFVAGVAALLWSVPTLWNSLTNDDLDGVLKATARDLGGDGPDNTFGHGLVRADSALILISPPNKIMKNQVSPTRIDSIETLDPQEFMNIPCVISGREQLDTLTAQMYEMVGYAPFVEPALAVWTRGRQTNGWRPLTTPPVTEVSDGSYDGLAYWNWAEVDSATVTAEGCSLRAYTYKFFKDGDFLGWYPVDGSTGLTTCTPSPQPASLAYTYVVGGGDPLAGDTPRLQLRIRGANPSNQAYHLSWTSSEREEVEAAIFDAAGRRIRLLFSGVAGPGETRLTWDLRDTNGRRVPAGVYFLKVTAGGAAGSRKLLVVPKGGGPR